MIKVIELIPTLKAGGAESLLRDYCTFIDRDKVRLKIIVMSGRYNTLNEKVIEDNGIEIVFLQNMIYDEEKERNKIQKGLVFISRYYFFRKIVIEDEPDIIHVHIRLGNYFRFLPYKKIKSRLLLTVHNTPRRYFDPDGKDRDKYREYKEAYRLIHRHGMRLIALHDSMNAELRELFDTEDVVTVYNGIDMPRFDRAKYDRISIRESLGIDENAFVIGNIGRFNYQKNHDKILSVFRKVRADKDNAILLLVGGSGDLEEKIKEQIKEYGMSDSVIILERRNDIPELMTAMDVMLFPSRWEGYPIVLLEAQAIGLKCVISNSITKEVILTDKISCLSVEEDDEAWSRAVLKDTKAEKSCANLAEFDMHNCINMIQDIYISMSKKTERSGDK